MNSVIKYERLIFCIFFYLQCTFGEEYYCNLTQSSTKNRINYLSYDIKEFKCLLCKSNEEKYMILVLKELNPDEDYCNECLGVMCKKDRRCTKNNIGNSVEEVCLELEDEPSKNHIPLIIGFAVGGIMLAVVIAGVLFGRANRGMTHSDSSVATTPVSMSYSEWISSYTTGGWGSKNLNNMVQESTGNLSDGGDSQALAVYSIVYEENYGTASENSSNHEAKATFLEIDEVEPYEEENKLTYFYEPSNEVLSCVETSVHNPKTIDNMTVSNGFCDQQSTMQIWKNKRRSFDCEKFFPYCKKQTYHFETDNFPGIDASQMESITTFSLYSNKQRDSWSDESYNDEYEYSQNFFCQYGKASQNAWTRVPTCMSINLENLKHVFVDVHRSMSYSFEDGCTVSYWPHSNSNETIDKVAALDNEKTRSYFTIRSHYVCCCCGSHAAPKIGDQLFICSLHQNTNKRLRRYSV